MNDGFEPYHSLDGEPQFMITEEKLKEITKWKVCYQCLKKRIDELIEDSALDCRKVIDMDVRSYCDCECCYMFDDLQKILGDEK